MRKCPVDQAPLIQNVFDVRKKNGTPKRLNMLLCQECGRRYINTAALSENIRLEDYELREVAEEQWKSDAESKN